MWALKSKRSRDYAGGMLMTAIGLAAAFQGSSYQLGTLERMGPGFFPTALGVILAGVGFAIAVSARFTRYEGELEVLAPEWRGWLCIIGALVAFVVLGKYGGLLPATFAIVFISALGDRQNTFLGAVLLALASVVVAIVIFWWALQMQFPPFQWGGA
ncbi:MAG TPA: tripartite tricarboxylate transporter TctB family protein [Casimicrobiaceae bacterium]|nr:tripartite tricarboxylate transporter TctB family protein [Casimicrobiaceae bacterium]